VRAQVGAEGATARSGEGFGRLSTGRSTVEGGGAKWILAFEGELAEVQSDEDAP
jgi:hypothetical protein